MNLQEKKGKKKKKNKNKVDSDPLAKSASVGVMPSYMSPVIPRSATTTAVAAPSSTSGGTGSSHTGTGNASSNSTSNSNAAAAANSLKSGPQVLIKNINGKVTITPVPGSGTGSAAEMVQQQTQGYYNTGWFKNDLSACWSYIRYPKKDQLNITESVCVNAPLEIIALNLEMIERSPLNKFSVPIQWEIKVL